MRFLILLTFTVLFFVSPNDVFAQLDTVKYQGPSTGSVGSGAMQNTDNFSDEFIPVSTGEYREIPRPQIPPDYYGEMPIIDESLNPKKLFNKTV